MNALMILNLQHHVILKTYGNIDLTCMKTTCISKCEFVLFSAFIIFYLKITNATQLYNLLFVSFCILVFFIYVLFLVMCLFMVLVEQLHNVCCCVETAANMFGFEIGLLEFNLFMFLLF